MSPKLECEFWNVGQGLFSSGRILGNNAPNFNWVYDCGTTPSQTLITSAVSEYHKVNHSDIDLMVLSHFDQDHISGVKTLLAGRKVKYWVVPYYPLWQRLVIATLENIHPSHELLDFYLNPVQYFTTYFSDERSEGKILFLPAKENNQEISINLESSDSDDNQSSLIFEETDALSDEFNHLDSNNKVHWLNPNKALLYKENGSTFEFVLYNVPFSMLSKSPVNLSAFQQQVEHIIQSKPNDPTEDLKQLYTSVFGKGGRNKNIISQYLYIRNTVHSTFYGWGNIHVIQHKNNDEISILPFNKLDNAILYTGDASLNNLVLLNDLKNALGQERMSRIYCLQVPHHGSKNNWQQGLADDLSPYISVFTADNARKKGHPHAEVVKDFLPYNPMIVNKDRMLKITSI